MAEPRLYGPRDRFSMAGFPGPRPSYGAPTLFGPRKGKRGRAPSNLETARRLTQAEQRTRTSTGGRAFGHTFRSHEDISLSAKNYPIGYARKHGGRGIAETRRDRFLNQLLSARGTGPVAPRRPTSFLGEALGRAHKRVQSFIGGF